MKICLIYVSRPHTVAFSHCSWIADDGNVGCGEDGGREEQLENILKSMYMRVGVKTAISFKFVWSNLRMLYPDCKFALLPMNSCKNGTLQRYKDVLQ